MYLILNISQTIFRIILSSCLVFIFVPDVAIWLVSKPFYYAKFIELSEEIRINPNSKMAFYNRATYRSEYGDRKGAILDYTQSIRVRTKYFKGKEASAYYQRGQEYELIGDLERAILDYAKSAEIYKQYGYIDKSKTILKERIDLIKCK